MSEEPNPVMEESTGPETPAASGSRYLSIPQRLAKYRTALTNATAVDEVASALALFGYGPDRLAEGEALLAAAEAAQTELRRERGEQYAATDAVEDARAALQGLYGVHLAVARIALARDRNARQALALVGSRSSSHTVYAQQAKVFYENLLPNTEWLAAMAGYGQTEENLIAGQTATTALITALAGQKKERGDAQDATVRRNNTLLPLESWMGEFFAIARLALTNSPQQLEMLGIVVPS